LIGIKEQNIKPLAGIKILSLACNLPGPVAVAELQKMGGAVTKIEPPQGDPLERYCPGWYEKLIIDQKLVILDLKDYYGQKQLDKLLEESDLLITSMRPAALEKLGLEQRELHACFPRLLQIQIVGYPDPRENVAGHDLTYLADLGLLTPPNLPKTLLADLAAAQEIVSTALAMLLARERRLETSYFARISIADAAAKFAAPHEYGLTATGGLLGGGFAGYNIYETADGSISVAALETHFWQTLLSELNQKDATGKELPQIFLTRTAAEWELWANERDIPLTALRP
jgi:crotonobetainyl-CoA:carnitine CoA-transferase CaiB-like acyl-CoA transferase